MPKHFANFAGINPNIFGDNQSGVWSLADQFYKKVRDKWVGADPDIVITMWGGGGGGIQFPGGSPTWGTPAPGGAGGSLIFTGTYSDLGASSGDTLYLYVGGGGNGPSPGGGGPNGGHPGSGGNAGPGNAQGGGGGMSSIYLNGTYSTGTRLFIAGGGGAGAFTFIAGYPEAFPPPASAGNNAGGGTQSAGGKAGTPPSYPNGNAGTQFTGGAGSQSGNAKSGGGGAGWYGGGGGGADTGAATGQQGGGGSNYHNPTISSPLVDHANYFNDPNFNPGAPMSWPIPITPHFGPRYSTSPSFPGTRSTLPGQNSGNPLYSLPYCGGSTRAGAGYPGSIHITVDGSTTSFTSVGPYTYTLP